VETTSHLSRLSRPRRIVLIVVLGSVCTIGPFSTDLYLPALPTVPTDLAASSLSIALTVTTFLVGPALDQLPAGPLSDTYGRRLPLLVLVASLGFMFPDSTALALSLHPDVAGSASAYFGTFRLGLGALATPLVGIGGAVSGLPMAIVIAVSSAAALAVFATVAARTRALTPVLDTPEEASADMPVG
jgi:MFS family permease